MASECGKLDHVLGTVSVVSRIPGSKTNPRRFLPRLDPPKSPIPPQFFHPSIHKYFQQCMPAFKNTSKNPSHVHLTPSQLLSSGAIRISPQEIMGPLTYGGGCPHNNSRVALSTVRAFDRGESAEEPLDGEGVVAVLTVHVQDPEGRAASVGRSLIPLRPGDGGASPLWIQLFTPTGANLLDGASNLRCCWSVRRTPSGGRQPLRGIAFYQQSSASTIT